MVLAVMWYTHNAMHKGMNERVSDNIKVSGLNLVKGYYIIKHDCCCLFVVITDVTKCYQLVLP